MAEYEYDSWGNCTITYDTNSIANTNPLRYRGYYYDSDTNLYYLHSRYYDANIGRFINADESIMLLSNVYNLYAYCENNPIMKSDISGYYSNSDYNCYSYAMGEYGKWLHPGKGKKNVSKNGKIINNKYLMPSLYTVDKLINWVINDFGKKVVRKVKNKNSKLKKGEYLVAVRIQKFMISGKCRHVGNFHFMKQDPQTKKWWDKPGKQAIECLGKINPDNSKNWGNCNSKTKYFAVKRKFTKK